MGIKLQSSAIPYEYIMNNIPYPQAITKILEYIYLTYNVLFAIKISFDRKNLLYGIGIPTNY